MSCRSWITSLSFPPSLSLSFPLLLYPQLSLCFSLSFYIFLCLSLPPHLSHSVSLSLMLFFSLPLALHLPLSLSLCLLRVYHLRSCCCVLKPFPAGARHTHTHTHKPSHPAMAWQQQAAAVQPPCSGMAEVVTFTDTRRQTGLSRAWRDAGWQKADYAEITFTR